MDFTRLHQAAANAVGAAQRQLPAELRPLARGVVVHYEPLPHADVVAGGFPPDILGLFSGSPHGTEFSESPLEPPQIHLYLDNLWEFAGEDMEVFREEARITYLHELGHYFGWDEDEIEERGLD